MLLIKLKCLMTLAIKKPPSKGKWDQRGRSHRRMSSREDDGISKVAFVCVGDINVRGGVCVRDISVRGECVRRGV